MIAALQNSVEIMKDGYSVTNQGGLAYEIDQLGMARRFLILGSAGGNHYTPERKLTLENAKNFIDALDKFGVATVEMLVQVAQAGLAPKRDTLLFGLALASAHPNPEVKAAALAAVPTVCRIATDLFEFVQFATSMRGWGRAFKRSVQNWYLERSVESLTYQMIKYRSRVIGEGNTPWTHADLLRLAHPRTLDVSRNALFKWAVDDVFPTASEHPETLDQLFAFEVLQKTKEKDVVVNFIREFNMPREALPTEWLNDLDVWSALLENMPMTAMLRNLATMTTKGLITQGSDAEKLVAARLTDDARLRDARIHPLNIFQAMMIYQSGRGDRGGQVWAPTRRVLDALNDGLYKAFEYVEPTNKNILVAVDWSGSMRASAHGFRCVEARQIATMMALVYMKAEPQCDLVVFDTKLAEPALGPNIRMDVAMDLFSRNGKMGGGTDCTLPITYAQNSGNKYDAIVTFTDSEQGGASGWAPPTGITSYRTLGYRSQAQDARGELLHKHLDAYREVSPQCRFVTVAAATNNFTLTRPDDHLGLDVAGFSSDAPAVISNFIANRF